MSKLSKILPALGVTALVAVGLQLVGLTPASAHDATPQGTSKCNVSDGTWTASGTAPLKDVPTNDPARVLLTSTAGTLTQAPLSTVQSQNSTYTFSVTGIPNNVASIMVKATTTWGANGVDGPRSSDPIARPTGCVVPPDQLPTPVQPQPTAPSCVVAGSLTVPANDANDKWLVDGNQPTPGQVFGPGTYTVSVHIPVSLNKVYADGKTSETWTIVVADKTSGDTCASDVNPVSPILHSSVCVDFAATTPSFDTPADGNGITYAANGQVVTATADLTHKFVTAPAGWTLVSPHSETFTVNYATAPTSCAPVKQSCDTATYEGTRTPSNTGAWYTEDGAPVYTFAGLDYNTVSGNKVNYFNPVNHVALAGISGLAYKINNTGGPQAAYDMEVDTLGTTGYTTLVYEPYNNGFTLDTGSQPDNHNYTDLEDGKWWSSHIASGPGSQAQPITLDEFDALYPHATIISYGVAQHNAGSDTIVNDVTFLCGTTTFTADKTDVSPVLPTTTEPFCNLDTGVVSPATITQPADTADITYSHGAQSGASGRLVEDVTATLVNPDTTKFGTLPAGYVLSGDGHSATITVDINNAVPCDAPTTPSTPPTSPSSGPTTPGTPASTPATTPVATPSTGTKTPPAGTKSNPGTTPVGNGHSGGNPGGGTTGHPSGNLAFTGSPVAQALMIGVGILVAAAIVMGLSRIGRGRHTNP